MGTYACYHAHPPINVSDTTSCPCPKLGAAALLLPLSPLLLLLLLLLQRTTRSRTEATMKELRRAASTLGMGRAGQPT